MSFQNHTDHLNDINTYAMTINEVVQNLENQLCKIDFKMITTLTIFFAVPSMHQHITPPINTLMATSPDLKVLPDDLLNMIQQIAIASPTFDHSTEIVQIDAASKFGTRYRSNDHPSNQNENKPNRSLPSLHCKKDTRMPRSLYPCHYCGKLGHWSPTCPI
ncbi:hypothetical protein O181_017281 [Austropuccinia psidii MF-1]|uniref:CCHC-type domain-containing protein n=1 Tax=Austropuccinia psidii MF-1 TaxID=1389203 RepID=A0A9Q3GRU6_9BASI|nr:hypothetical protein [Austropuccinia psidii MF-1]